MKHGKSKKIRVGELITMMVKLRLRGLIEDLEAKQLTKNEEAFLELIKTLVEYREYDSTSALFDLRVNVDYFWLRLNDLEKEINNK